MKTLCKGRVFHLQSIVTLKLTCKDIDFRLGLPASDGLAEVEAGEDDWAAWAGEAGCGDGGGFFAGAAAAGARLLPELCADIVPRDGAAGDADAA